jgi:glucose-6-phosphate isomerase
VHPGQPWALDLTRTGVTASAIDALPWERAFAEMEALEAGNIANPDEGRQVGHYWLRAPERAPTIAQGKAIGGTRDAVLDFAEGVRTGEIAAPDGEPFTEVILIGIGGKRSRPATPDRRARRDVGSDAAFRRQHRPRRHPAGDRPRR